MSEGKILAQEDSENPGVKEELVNLEREINLDTVELSKLGNEEKKLSMMYYQNFEKEASKKNDIEKDEDVKELIEKTEKSWKDWCENKERNYIFEKQLTDKKNEFSFLYYKNEQDKKNNNPAAILSNIYNDDGSVTTIVKTPDGKPADYELYRQDLKNHPQFNSIDFNEMQKNSPMDAAKLYLACVVFDKKTENVNPEDLSIASVFNELPYNDQLIVREKLLLDENGNRTVQGLTDYELSKKVDKTPEEERLYMKMLSGRDTHGSENLTTKGEELFLEDKGEEWSKEDTKNNLNKLSGRPHEGQDVGSKPKVYRQNPVNINEEIKRRKKQRA